MKRAKRFKEELTNYFMATRKTGWNRKEVIDCIKDLWTVFLERELSKKGVWK